MAGFGQLDSQRTVVTGASSGIGREIAIEFARAGAGVLVHCRGSLERAEETAAEIGQLGGETLVKSADFAVADHVEQFVQFAWEEFGPIDVWVNNAGADLLTGDPASWGFSEKLATLFDVDVRSTLVLSRAIGAKMMERGRGAIINIGWDQADRGMEGDSGELFAASKNAIMGFTKSLSLSLAPSVRVNCIAPGWIRTKWGEQAGDHWQERVQRETPLKRWGTPRDIARMARFLASSDADFITGQVINVNGGAIR